MADLKVLRSEVLDAAERELGAAEAILLDARCHGVIEAALHIARGWRAVAKLQSIGKDTDARPNLTELDPIDLPLFGPTEREEWRSSLERMSNVTFVDSWEVSPDVLPSRRLLVRHCRWLRTTTRNARGRLAVKRARDRSVLRGVYSIVAVAVVAAVGVLTPFSVKEEAKWRISYFNNIELTGTPVLATTDELLFDWYDRAPMPSIQADGFSAVFESCLRLESPERVRFVLGSDDGSRLIVDGRVVIDNWSQQPYRTVDEQLDLQPGNHLIRVEYFDLVGRARIGLWSAFGGELTEPLPASRLQAPRDGGEPCH